MGGGQPYDALGGQFATATSNGVPVSTSKPFDYSSMFSGLGKGFQSAGSAIAGSSGGTAQVSSPSLPYDQYSEQPSGVAIIPQTQLPPQTEAMLDALMRIGIFGGQ